jgi:flagellar motor protein MotB
MWSHGTSVSKLDPSRLSAEGFGQYRPASRRDKAANRRIEIVLSPKPAPTPAPKPAPKK